ncbi:hypothetical protein [Microcoleus vaginatus]
MAGDNVMGFYCFGGRGCESRLYKMHSLDDLTLAELSLTGC